MPSKYFWQYYLVVPTAALAAADAVAPALNNPDGIEPTFRRYPLPDAEDEYLEPATHWAASFMACDLMSEGNPSRQALEGHLGKQPALKSLLWVRCKNPHHPETPESDRGVVVASNWDSFPPGAEVDWPAVFVALS